MESGIGRPRCSAFQRGSVRRSTGIVVDMMRIEEEFCEFVSTRIPS
jgi:hypothetical protein